MWSSGLRGWTQDPLQFIHLGSSLAGRIQRPWARITHITTLTLYRIFDSFFRSWPFKTTSPTVYNDCQQSHIALYSQNCRFRSSLFATEQRTLPSCQTFHFFSSLQHRREDMLLSKLWKRTKQEHTASLQQRFSRSQPHMAINAREHLSFRQQDFFFTLRGRTEQQLYLPT